MALGKLFSGLFGNKNPTEDWVEDPSRTLHIDFDKPSISGVAVGQATIDLNWLGQAERAEKGLYEFLRKGLTVSEKDGTLDWFGLEFHHTNGFQPVQGTFTANGQPLTLSPEAMPEELIEQLGEPAYREVEEKDAYGQLTLGYQLGKEFAFNFHTDADGQHRLYAVFG